MTSNPMDRTEVSGTNTINRQQEQQQQQAPMQLLWKTKKRPRKDVVVSIDPNEQQVIESEFSLPEKNGDIHQQQELNRSAASSSGPLVIPVASDQNSWKSRVVSHRTDPTTIPSTELQQPHRHESMNNSKINVDDELEAIQSLQEDINNNADDRSVVVSTNTTNRLGKIHNGSNVSTSDREIQQYTQDIELLPAALDENGDEYHRVPISEFGAALLRGMGWKEEEEDGNKHSAKTIKNDFMPRPHRLGLGAIPAKMDEPMEQNGKRRYRNMDQYERDKRLKEQNEMYRQQREKKVADDLQRTLQNGSIVFLTSESSNETLRQQQRAKILKLVGVPGLNMVQIQIEQSMEPTNIKRNEIDRLVSRDELDQNPFREATRDEKSKDWKHGWNDGPEPNQIGSNIYSKKQPSNSEKKRNRKEVVKAGEQIRTKHTWVIPNIRVRIITEKLGRRYYKEKGVVVDVTHLGATLELSNVKHSSQSNDSSTAFVLDRIPERYLETALPKVGGNVVVVNFESSNKYAKGRLLERDSRYGVVQFYDDLNCIKLPLDDIAEWCGPLDHDEGHYS